MTSFYEGWCHNGPLLCHCLAFCSIVLPFTFVSLNCKWCCFPGNICLLIELKCKLLHYNKVTSLCHWIAPYVIKTLFWTIKFCWKIEILKIADNNILVLLSWIICLIYLLYNLITFSKLTLHAFWTILW